MNIRLNRVVLPMVLALYASLSWATAASNESRTVEFPFKLSSDVLSEFRAKAPVISAGPIVIEAQWASLKEASASERIPSPLTLILLRPDGIETARKRGVSPLRLEHRITESEVEGFSNAGKAAWSVKLLNDADEKRHEIQGKLRITLPVTAKVLVDMQFTLLPAGNAQEMAFAVNAPGRLVMEATWQADPLAEASSQKSPLTLQLIHTGTDRIYARRRGSNALRIEQQVTEQEIDRGLRWLARIQNEGQAKVKGLLKITFVPTL